MQGIIHMVHSVYHAMINASAVIRLAVLNVRTTMY